MQYLRLFAVLYVSVFLFGMNVGIQGLFSAVAQRGVFSDLCTTASNNNTAVSSSDIGSSSVVMHHLVSGSERDFFSGSASSESGSASSSHHPGGGELSRPVPSAFPCLRQEQMLATIVNIMLSMTNLVSLPNGFLIDAAGGEPVTIVAIASWVLGTSVAGIYPANGIMWSCAVCLSGWANSAAFMSFSTLQLRIATDFDQGKYAFWSTVSMACRAIGALASIPMSYFLSISEVPFWLLYLIWGAVVGLPVLIVFVVLFIQTRRSEARKRKEAEQQERAARRALRVSSLISAISEVGEIPESSEDITTTTSESSEDDGGVQEDREERRDRKEEEKKEPPPVPKSKIKIALGDVRAVFFTLPFLTITLRLTVLVAFGSFFIANLGALGRYKGATSSEMEALRQHFTYFLGALGATNPIPGYLIKRLGTARGISVVAVVCIGFSAIFVSGSLIDPGTFNWTFYLVFAFFALWRYWGYGVCALYLPTVFPERKAGFGLMMGSMSGIAGGISMAIGTYLTHLVQENPNILPYIFGSFAGLEVLADILTVVAMRSLPPPRIGSKRERSVREASKRVLSVQEGEKRLLLNEKA